MPIVAVYKFRAKFRALHDAEDAPPRLVRDGLLLLRQETDTRSDADAIAACKRLDAFDAVIERYSAVDPASLDTPQGREFAPLVAQAQREGSALVYYENAAPEPDTSFAGQAGFSPQRAR